MGIELVVGLGNPGEKYAGTRHNVGFLAVERFLPALEGRKDWRRSPVGEGDFAEGLLGGERRVRLAKPATFMNESGSFVRAFSDYYRVPPESILVVSDDMDLQLGDLRIRLKGSSGGQRGLDSILSALGTQQVPRLRLGIGPRPPHIDGADFVLGRFRPEEKQRLESMLDRAEKALRSTLVDGLEAAMNSFNAKVPEP